MKKIIIVLLLMLLLVSCGTPRASYYEGMLSENEYTTFCSHLVEKEYIRDWNGAYTHYDTVYTYEGKFYNLYVSMDTNLETDEVVIRNTPVNPAFESLSYGTVIHFFGTVKSKDCSPLEIEFQSLGW